MPLPPPSNHLVKRRAPVDLPGQLFVILSPAPIEATQGYRDATCITLKCAAHLSGDLTRKSLQSPGDDFTTVPAGRTDYSHGSERDQL